MQTPTDLTHDASHMTLPGGGRRVSLIFGTRPEAIKLCPLVLEFQKHPEFEPHVCVTGQHRQMLDQVLEVFEVTPDVDLNLMQPDQTLAGLTSRAVSAEVNTPTLGRRSIIWKQS